MKILISALVIAFLTISCVQDDRDIIFNNPFDPDYQGEDTTGYIPDDSIGSE